jgi:NAD(P)-dependent dehydrogenase (short-subunit alcohol dehydrogenase family)
MSVQGPVYVILGATGGIGSELSRALAAKGATLLLGARHKEKLDALAGELDARAFPLDATRMDEVEECVAAAIEQNGALHGVANCVGSLLLKAAHGTSEEEWFSVIQTNLTSSFAAVRAAGKHMRKGGGSVALVSTAAARHGLANHEALAAAKAGVIGLVLSAAATYARYNIRFNCVAPGLVRTPMTASITGNDVAVKASTAMHALGRIGQPTHVASGLAWLLDPAQDWVTGQVLGIDGGLSSVMPRIKV